MIKQTKNLSLNDIYLDVGSSYDDCMKFQIASEHLGYVAIEVGSDSRGYPSSYHLTKAQQN